VLGITLPAESFWATLEVECYDRYLWPTRAAAKLAVGDWIERVYKNRGTQRDNSIPKCFAEEVEGNHPGFRRRNGATQVGIDGFALHAQHEA
jgi:hypothetical protein